MSHEDGMKAILRKKINNPRYSFICSRQDLWALESKLMLNLGYEVPRAAYDTCPACKLPTSDNHRLVLYDNPNYVSSTSLMDPQLRWESWERYRDSLKDKEPIFTPEEEKAIERIASRMISLRRSSR